MGSHPQGFLKYQAILVQQDDAEITATHIVNPASTKCRGTPYILRNDSRVPTVDTRLRTGGKAPSGTQ